MAGQDGKRPLPRLLALGEMQERNRLAAQSELQEDRADCIAFLKHTASAEGSAGIRALIAEAMPMPQPARQRIRRSA